MGNAKKIYMQVLYNTKNKQTVDAMSWDELFAYFSFMKLEQKGME